MGGGDGVAVGMEVEGGRPQASCWRQGLILGVGFNPEGHCEPPKGFLTDGNGDCY